MSAARESHLREFEADGPEKVRENVSLNRYDRRTLARAVLWLERHGQTAASVTGRRSDGAAVPSTPPPRKGARPKNGLRIAMVAAAIVIVVAIAVVLVR